MKHILTTVFLTLVVTVAFVFVYSIETVTTPIIKANLEREANQGKYDFFKDVYDVNDLEATVLCDLNEETEITEDCGIEDFVLADTTLTEVSEMRAAGELVGYIYQSNASGFGGQISYIIAVNNDPVNPLVMGIKVLTHAETPGLGALITTEEFTNQFVQVDLNMMYDDGFDGVTSATPKMTNAGMNESVAIVLETHKVSILNEEAPVFVRPEPEILTEDDLAGLIEGATTYRQVYADLEYNEYVLNIYVASDGENDLGAIYFASADGISGEIKYIVAFDQTNQIVALDITNYGSKESWVDSGFSDEEFEDSPWLDEKFRGKYASDIVKLDNEQDGVDVIAGVSTTTTAMILSMQDIAYYQQIHGPLNLAFDVSELIPNGARLESSFDGFDPNVTAIKNIYTVYDNADSEVGTIVLMQTVGTSGPFNYYLAIDENNIITALKIIDRAKLESWEQSGATDDVMFIDDPWAADTLLNKSLSDLQVMTFETDGKTGVTLTTTAMIETFNQLAEYMLGGNE